LGLLIFILKTPKNDPKERINSYKTMNRKKKIHTNKGDTSL
jgi:hypothetical protein